jgi:predicted nucleic acid-binding protein
MNLVDSSGWLEYFADGKNAEYFAAAIHDTDNLIVSTINLYEVFKRILQQRDENSAFQAIAMMQQGQIVEINIIIALNAARNSIELKLPMADSLIFTTAQMSHATLWTQNSDFEKLTGVEFIRKRP